MPGKHRYLGLGLVVLVTAGSAHGWQALSASEAISRQPHIRMRNVPQAMPTPDCVSNMLPMTNPSPAGPVMTAFTAYLIFWLPSGIHFESSAAADLNYEHLLQRYFQDIGGTSFYDILSQYGGSNGSPSSIVSIGDALVDTTPYPRAGTIADPLLDDDIQNEVLNLINNRSWPVGLNAMYFVFTGQKVQSCADASLMCCTFSTASSTGYCAYHSSFDVVDDHNNQRPVIYANMPEGLSIGPNGECDIASPNGDADADTEISLTSHEHFEGVSNPTGFTWSDIDGCEIADKCAGPFDTSEPDISLGGHPYYVPEEWSNAAGGCTLVGPPTPTSTLTPSQTPTPSQTTTPRASTPTVTYTPTVAVTATPTATDTVTPTQTATRTPTVTPPLVPSTTPTVSGCIGDCTNSGDVTTGDLLTMINIGLGNAALTSCMRSDSNHDGRTTVDEVLSAANNTVTHCSLH